MHELSIALNIVEVAQEAAQSRGASHVSAVHLRLGQLSGVVKDALLFSYEIACQQTALAGSRLVIEEVPVIVNCPHCKARRTVRSLQMFCCSECGTPAPDVVEGRELLVTALEITQ
jgi:hydrogenase nickel incorporation protein HypA/HybF